MTLLTKEYLIMKEIVCKYHPDYKRSRTAIKNAHHYKVERLVEETMALVGGYERVDEAHYDFSDLSDSKTSTITKNKKWNSGSGKITGVARETSDETKWGDLRVVIYNSVTEKMMYYFLPYKFWIHYIYYSNNIGSIPYTYNVYLDKISRFEEYRCDTFESLAKMEATI
jgi:hypothetical protein